MVDQRGSMDGARVVVLGGCGFIGRNFVSMLIERELCACIRVVDKTLPALAFLSDQHRQVFSHDSVEFIQADLSREDHVTRAFRSEGGSFRYVFNFCGETRFGLPEKSYEKNILQAAELCGEFAVRQGVEKFVEISTASVYKPQKEHSSENSELAPSNLKAAFRLKAENALRRLQDLPLVVLRPALVYGNADLTSLTPRISTAAVYSFLNEKMNLLWSKSLAINCVHVRDVCEATWMAATDLAPGSTFNLADHTDLNQGKLNSMLAEMFGIKTGFHGPIVSNFAKLSFETVVSAANGKHVPGWQKLCQKYNILNTPISPFLDSALLRNRHLSIDGSAIEKLGNFQYSHPTLRTALLRKQVECFIEQKLFPPVLCTYK